MVKMVFSVICKEILETALGEELNQHLQQEEQYLGNDCDNRKNGYNSKTVKTKDSTFILDTP
jgi:transposase-like protein